jgi:hypothetical protein
MSNLFSALTPNAKVRKTCAGKKVADVALQRAPAATARAGLDMLAWANGAVYHAWRLAESLRIASSK